MPCDPVTLPGGGTAIVCSRRPAPKRCVHCGARSWKLCDGPAAAGPPGATCDRSLCDRCAIHVAPDLDFCRDHRRAAQAAVAHRVQTSVAPLTAPTRRR